MASWVHPPGARPAWRPPGLPCAGLPLPPPAQAPIQQCPIPKGNTEESSCQLLPEAQFPRLPSSFGTQSPLLSRPAPLARTPQVWPQLGRGDSAAASSPTGGRPAQWRAPGRAALMPAGRPQRSLKSGHEAAKGRAGGGGGEARAGRAGGESRLLTPPRPLRTQAPPPAASPAQTHGHCAPLGLSNAACTLHTRERTHGSGFL